MSNYTYAIPVAQAKESVRAEFIRKTYQHLACAILGFIVLEYLLLSLPIAHALTGMMLGSRFAWLIVLGMFMAVSYVADKWARSATSLPMQYAGLSLFVLAEAIIFLPLLFIAGRYAPDVIPTAAIITLLLFGGLTFTAFTTRKDFSFLRGILGIGGFVALGFIVASILFGFSLGIFFSLVMVVFAAVAILYSTSNIIHHYRTDQHVAAALSLFSGVALLFWYILQILLSLAGSD